MLALQKAFPTKPQKPLLELGSGDGEQANLWVKLGPVVCTDPYPPTTVVFRNFVIANAENLPFASNSFSAVISSSVIEHIPHKDRAFEEMKRVVAADGVFAHIVPTHIWKLLSFYIELPLQFLRALGFVKMALSHKGHVNAPVFRASWQFTPPVHGVAASHAAEFYEFMPKSWKNLFEGNGFYISYEEDLLLYTSFPSLLPPNRIGAWLGFPSSVLYLMKTDRQVA